MPERKNWYFHMTPYQVLEVRGHVYRLQQAVNGRKPGWMKVLLVESTALMNVVNACTHDEPEKLTAIQ